MQPTPLVLITGSVTHTRPVVIEPREATDTAKAYAGGAYVEVTLMNPNATLGGEDIPGVVAFSTVRFSTDDSTLPELVPGTQVELLCTAFVDLYRVRGRWANSVGYRFSRLASPARFAAPSAA